MKPISISLERFWMKDSPSVAPIVKGDKFNLNQWRAAKKVFRYLQRMKDYMLMYGQMDNLEVIDYSDSEFFGCDVSSKSISG